MAAVVAASVLLHSAPSFAQAQRVVRDEEVESLLRDYAAPIFQAAGFRSGSIRIILLNDRSFNAFVADGRKLFINVGAIMDAKTPNEIIGVLAHESGHIAGGHLVRLRQQLATAQIMSVAGMLLGAGAMAGGVAAGNRVGNGALGGAGVMMGSQELVRRSMLSYQRGEELAADRMAVTYLTATKQSPAGILETFRRFNQDAMFKTASIDPYMISHPLPAERIAALEELARQSPYVAVKDPPALQARHDMARAKLFGFVARPDEVGRRYPLSDMSLPARYARAIVAYRTKRLQDALTQIDGLLREQPNNPYFWELKGQVLLEFGRAQEAIGPLRKAVAAKPSSGLLRILLGQALVATEEPRNVDDAIRELSNATQREPESADAWEQLSRAYGLKNNIGMAEYAAAQAYFIAGQYDLAATQASRAKEKLPPNSPAWLRADDILNARIPKKE
jgi:predicted Zn-dependent protease